MGLLVTLLLLSGCWLQVGYGPEHRRHNDLENRLTVTNVASLEEHWSLPRTLHFDEPIVSKGRVFVRDSQNVLAVDADDGSVIWERAIPNNSSLALSEGALWTSRWEGTAPLPDPRCSSSLLRLDPDTGATISEEPGVVARPPVTAGPIVVYAQQPLGDRCERGNWTLVVRDRTTLDVRWTYAFPEPGGNSDLLPTVTDDAIYITNGPILYAFPLECGSSCQPLWTYDLGGIPGRYVVAGEDGQLFVRRPGGSNVVLSADTGTELWSMNRRGEMALADDVLYVTANGALWAFDANGCGSSVCDAVWMAPLPSATSTNHPVVAGGVVYVAGNDRTIYALDASGCGTSSCEPLVSLPTGTGLAAELVVADGTLFALTYATETTPYELIAFRPRSLG